MATSGLSLVRLPAEAEAQRILADAVGKLPHSEELKARWNLCRSLEWAYKNLSVPEKVAANRQYLLGSLAIDIGQAIQKHPPLADLVVMAMLRALIAGAPALQHPGGARLAQLSIAQELAIDSAITALDTHVAQISAGTHDAIIEQMFPKGDWDDKWALIGYSNADVVKKTFVLALAAVRGLRNAGNIKVDAFASPIGAAGLTSTARMTFPSTFFDKRLNEMEATVAHESTHAITDNGSRTGDEGGYIGSPKFANAIFAERRKNAAHFEAVIRLINGENLAGGQGAGPDGPKGQANEIMRRAWGRGLDLYLQLHEFHEFPANILRQPSLAKPSPRQISKILGLSTHKKPDGPINAIAEGELAAAENRVGKLGALFGAVNRACDLVQLDDPPLTVDKILARLVEMGGPLRKTTNHAKTIAMIKTLANWNDEAIAKFARKDYT